MGNNYYLTHNGTLKRDQNTLLVVTDEEKHRIPVADVDTIHAFAQITVNSRLCSFLAQKNIPLHFYNYFDYYSGSFYPREFLQSGETLVNQVKAYSDVTRRVGVARRMVEGAIRAMETNLTYYVKKGRNLKSEREELEEIRNTLVDAQTPQELRGQEGRARKIYYGGFEDIIQADFPLNKRSYNPPANELNALISFGNSLLYSSTLTEIYKTQLNPTVSFVHEPGNRRFSLSLDISDIFKPLIVDRCIFTVLNRNQITKDDFQNEANGCLLTDSGRETFIKTYENKLDATLEHANLNRSVRYQKLLRLECYKLIKHINGEQQYEPFDFEQCT